MNKNLMCIILAAILLFTGSAFADTSIFVATDRHAKYETVNDPVEGNDSLAQCLYDLPAAHSAFIQLKHSQLSLPL